MLRMMLLAWLAFFVMRTPNENALGAEDNHEAYEACAKACGDCQRACDSCTLHCAKRMAEGKKDHLQTLRTCQDCATHCAAAAGIVARKGPFSDLICTACAEACARCAKECERYPDDKHMQQCARECRNCEKACRRMLKQISDNRDR